MAAEPRPIEVRLLGVVEVARAGVTVSLGGDRQRTLLALLALDPRRASPVERLVDQLWAGEPPAGGETSLRSYVTRLRAALGDAAPIHASGHGYALDVPDDAIDALRFQNLARDGAAALGSGHARLATTRLTEALALWRGRPFADLGDVGALGVEAERLERLRLDALEHRIEADLALGQIAGLSDELEQLLREHPYREAFWRQLMLALYRSERQADALAAYLRARDALDEELGVEPGPELQALQAAILRQDVPPLLETAVPNNLPAALTTFIGRENELVDVAGLLDAARLVTLTGVGGVGKTRLALEAAARSIDRFRDGATFIDLTPLTDSTLVAPSVASVLEVGSGAGETAARVAEHLRSREMLLVVDNCEQVRDAVAALLRAVLAAAPDLRVIATSREVLGVPGEVTFTVPPLGLQAPKDDGGAESEAVRLFMARARDIRPGLAESAETLQTVRRICTDLEGLPLAIELAAARTRVLSIAEIAERLGDRLALLVSWRTLAPSRHRTLREALDWSYELLGPDEQRLLADLSVFSGGFTLDAAASVCLAGYQDATLALLLRLVEASMVSVDVSLEPTRYRMLETVREYAADRLGSRRQTIEVALAAWVQSLLETVVPDGTKPIPTEVYNRLDADLDNIRSALRIAAADPDPAREVAIAAGSWKYWLVHGAVGEAHNLYDSIIARRGIVETPQGIRAARAAANLAWSTGDMDRAETLGSEVLAAARRTGNVFEQASTLNLLGITSRARKELGSAEDRLGEAIQLARGMDNAELVAMYQGNLATIHMDAGRLDSARELLEGVLAYREPEGKSSGVGYARLNLGEVELEAGNLPTAEEHFLAAVDAFRAVGFRTRIGNALQGLAAVEVRTGREAVAARRLGEAAAVLGTGSGWATGDSPLEAMALERARAALGDSTFAQLFEEGRAGVVVAPA